MKQIEEIKMKKILTSLSGIAILTLAACAAKTLTPEAEAIELVNERPDLSKCEYLGEIVGSHPAIERGKVGRQRNGVLAEIAALQGRITTMVEPARA